MARTRGRSSRLSKSWTNMTVADRVTIGTTQTVIGSVTIAEGAGQANTLLRSRGGLMVWGEPDASTDSDVCALGLIVVHSNALAVGGTSVPGPLNDQGADWLWHRYVPLDAGIATGVVGDNILAIERFELDSKAMRRVPEDSSVVLIGEVSVGDFAAVFVSGGVRFLLGH